VAEQLTAYNALAAHAREELGFSAITRARSVQAALASACMFAVEAAVPLIGTAAVPEPRLAMGVGLISLCSLALLEGLSASAGGAVVPRTVLRVTFWGALAMAMTGADRDVVQSGPSGVSNVPVPRQVLSRVVPFQPQR